MHLPHKPTFSQLVCSAAPVRTAFAEHTPTRCWWRIILLLHGKPMHVSLSAPECTRRIAEGFLFYANLYQFLAGLFALLSLVLFWSGQVLGTSCFYGGACLLAALYLWSASRLGRTGASAYTDGKTRGTLALLTFLILIIAFLSAFVAAVSVVALHRAWVPPPVNLFGTSALLLFGVGSYLVEVVYLITRPHAPPERIPE